jgi:hypothetical protein
MSILHLLLLATGLLQAQTQTAVSLEGSFVLPTEDPSIGYNTGVLNDPVTRLQKRIAEGDAKLAFDPKNGWLTSVLRELSVPVSSQMLVFSKTSFQINRIAPETPRAIYFGDDVYIGWVQDGDVMEVSAVDPQKGGVFYSVNQRDRQKPVFTRRDECLQCHASPKTLGVPGHMVRSVFTGADGFPQFQAGGFHTDHRSPFEERWGGWFVTGTHGSARHMGNVFSTDRDHPEKLDVEKGANVTSLKKLLNVEPYLSPYSDIVALLVLEHQARMHNLITRVNYETRMALSQQEGMNKALGRPLHEWSDSTRRRIFGASEVLLQYMLFTDETPLTAPVKGMSTFQADFSARGPRDSKGRSLRDFDLKTHIFRNRCSYLIYSDAFDALPKPALDYIYRRLFEVLSGKDESKTWAGLPTSERATILQILRETKKDLPDYWR